MITPASREALKLYGHYRNRILPFAGGILDQPNWYVAAMEAIEKELSNGDE